MNSLAEVNSKSQPPRGKRRAFAYLRFTIYDLRFTIYDLRFTIYELRYGEFGGYAANLQYEL